MDRWYRSHRCATCRQSVALPDAVVHSYGIVPLFGIRHRGWTGFVSKDIPELKRIRTRGSEDYKWDRMLLIAIVEEP